MINILWIVVVLMAVVSQWYIITKKRRKPHKKFWLIVRVVVSVIFLYFYIQLGYMWYWAIIYMVGTFWFPFNFLLSFIRGVPQRFFGDDFIDKFLLRYFSAHALFWWSFILLVISVGLMVFYGKVSFNEVSYLKL